MTELEQGLIKLSWKVFEAWAPAASYPLTLIV